MTIIEGFGDEIIHIAIGIGVICLSVLAWWSTHIRDVALYRTIVIVERNRNNNNNNSVADNNQVEPLAGIPVSRNVHRTVANETESDTEDSSSREQTPSADNGEASSTAENPSEPSPSPSLQSERPLLVGDYVNPSLQNPPVPSESTDTTTSSPVDATDASSDIRIRLKYLNDEERIVDGKPNELLGDFKKRHFRSELSSNKVVRLIYNGHILQQDNAPLRSCGLFNNCVIHCLVHPRRNHPSSGPEGTRRGTHAHNSHHASHHHGGAASSGADSVNNGSGGSGAASNDRGTDEWGDLGGIFYVLISIVLCSAWYWRFQHSHLFSFTATAALSSITAIFSIFVFSITFFHNDEIPIEIM